MGNADIILKLYNNFLVYHTKFLADAKIDNAIGSDYFYTHKVFIDFTKKLIYTT